MIPFFNPSINIALSNYSEPYVFQKHILESDDCVVLFYHNVIRDREINVGYQTRQVDGDKILQDITPLPQSIDSEYDILDNISEDDLRILIKNYKNLKLNIFYDIIDSIINDDKLKYTPNDHLLNKVLDRVNELHIQVGGDERKINRLIKFYRENSFIKYDIIYNKKFYSAYIINSIIYLIYTPKNVTDIPFSNKSLLFRGLMKYEFLNNCEHDDLIEFTMNKIKRTLILNNMGDKKYLDSLILYVEFLRNLNLEKELREFLKKTASIHFKNINCVPIHCTNIIKYLINHYLDISNNIFTEIKNKIESIKTILEIKKNQLNDTIDCLKREDHFNLPQLNLNETEEIKTLSNININFDISFNNDNIKNTESYKKYNFDDLNRELTKKYISFFTERIFAFSNFYMPLYHFSLFEKKIINFF